MARKKYYQSAKDRKDESRGMKRYEERKREDRKAESRGMKKYEARKKKDRMDERRGMEEYYRKMRRSEHYAGADPRRRRELEDGNMVHEDHMAMANLPEKPIMRYYPKFEYGLDGYLDDTIGGIDRQMYDDMDEMKRHLKPEKW